jgi:hypothetical protein
MNTDSRAGLAGDYVVDPGYTRIGLASRSLMLAGIRGEFAEDGGSLHPDDRRCDRGSMGQLPRRVRRSRGRQQEGPACRSRNRWCARRRGSEAGVRRRRGPRLVTMRTISRPTSTANPRPWSVTETQRRGAYRWN